VGGELLDQAVDIHELHSKLSAFSNQPSAILNR
jgi:hypothetical protein